VKPIEVIPVRTSRERKIFLTFPWEIYAHDPLWVPPILEERARVIDPRAGVFFQRGAAEFFIAWRAGRPVGTICAAEDKAMNGHTGLRECIFGFFECIQDLTVAAALLDRAAGWAKQRGLIKLSGPFNLDYEDAYGVLVEGRDRPPVLLCGHSPAYYQGLFEGLGFSTLRGDNLAYEISITNPPPGMQRAAALAERIRRKGTITIRTPDKNRWEREIDVVHELLERSTVNIPNRRPFERESVASLLAAFRAIADTDLILFAEAGGRTVGWFPGVPNVNEILTHANGFRRPWDRLKVLPYRLRKIRCLAIKSVLVLPEYWGSGAALLLIDEMARRGRAKGYTWADLSLTSEDNPDTPALAAKMGARIYKRYRTYTKDITGDSA
jgi:GNAT superfamily N-acetyltransferase